MQTAWALLGLMAAGCADKAALRRGVEFLRVRQLPSGGINTRSLTDSLTHSLTHSLAADCLKHDGEIVQTGHKRGSQVYSTVPVVSHTLPTETYFRFGPLGVMAGCMNKPSSYGYNSTQQLFC